MAPGTTAIHRGRSLLALVALLLAPYAFRVATIAGRSTLEFAAQDLRGFLADTAAAFAVFALLLALGRLSRIGAALLAVLWTLLQNANYENILLLGAIANVFDIAYLGDSTFLRGSAVVFSSPLVLAVVVPGSAALAYVGLREASPRSALAALLAAAALFGSYALWPFDEDFAVWRQTNVLPYNLGILARSRSREEGERSSSDATAALLEILPALRADLDGKPIFEGPHPGSNVLLLILESVSGARIESIARQNGVEAGWIMPELDAIARANLRFSTFVAHQRKTSRGVYSLLCGDLPNLLHGSMKMSEYASGGRPCLPELLADAGYETLYLQGAPLAFQMKGQFMPRAGFRQIYGNDWFEDAHARSYWGVDDRALFEASLEFIDELEAGERPWFLTLLTVGTHQPVILPADFESTAGDDFARALDYLDHALADLFRGLEERGVLDDTLVLITSDEARGNVHGEDFWAAKLTENWGFLVVKAPGVGEANIAEPFGQVDVALSVLDYLGMGERGAHLLGRSVLRRYAEPRYLFFGNTNRHVVGAIDPDGRVLQCIDYFDRCRRFEKPPGRIFDRERLRLDWVEAEDSILREVAYRSVPKPPEDAEKLVYEMMSDPHFVVDRAKAELVYGGQFLTVEPGQWAELELEISAEGGDGEAIFFYRLRIGDHHSIFDREVALRAGDTLRVKLTYAPEEVQRKLRCHANVRLVGGSRVDLTFYKAKLTVHRRGEPPPLGVTVDLHDVEERAT